MTDDWEVDRAAVRAFVERVAAEYGAASVVADADLGARGPLEVRVVLPGDGRPEGEPADLVVAIDPPARSARWEEYLAARARQARKVLVVLVRNAERPGRRGRPGTAALAAVLWQAGRVREHAYLGLPRVLGRWKVVQVPVGALVRRTARMHAFVVDTAPRTPQARRRLRVGASS